MLSNFVSVIIRIPKIPLTTSLNSSNFDAKELIISVPLVTLLTVLTLSFLSFEIQSCWQVLSELIFVFSGIKLVNLLMISGEFFHY